MWLLKTFRRPLGAARQSPLWVVIASYHIAYVGEAWLRYMYGGVRLLCLPEVVTDAFKRFQVEPGFVRALGGVLNVRELLAHLAVHDKITWASLLDLLRTRRYGDNTRSGFARLA